MRRSLRVPAALLILATWGCAPSAPFTPPEDPMVGKPAPPFVFHNVHKRSFPSETFRGRSLVLIFIRPGQPEVQDLLREIGKMRLDPVFSAVQFLAILPEEDPLTEPFWVGLRSSIPVALDFTRVAPLYGARSLPLVVIRDHRGLVRLRLDGYLGKDFLPRLAATRRILKEAEEARSRPSTSPS